MKIRSLLNWKLFGLLLGVGLFGTWGYFYVVGIPYPFCEFRTNIIETIEILPPEEELIRYFQNNSWEIKFDNFDKQPKSLPHKEHILEIQAYKSAFFSKPHVTAYVAVMKPEADVDFEGQLQIFIEEGNRVANKSIYEDLIYSLNQQFDLNVNPVKFNYMSFCN